MPANKSDGSIIRLEDYQPSDYLIPAIRLHFDLDPDATHVQAELTVQRADKAPKNAPLVLDGDDLTLSAISIDGKTLSANEFELSPKGLTIKRLPAGRTFSLKIETVVSPSANTKLMGLYRSNGVYCTQCEAEGFRRITYFLDRPDILSVYSVRVEADAKTAPLLLSNGNPAESGKLDGGRHFAVWHDPFPKPSYLFALVAGDLGKVSDSFITASGRQVALGVYVEHGKESRAAYAMDALKRSMRWDEERFGREYDLDVFNIVAVSDFILGAMENKGLNIFNDKYVLADEQTATDTDFAGIEAIIAHEYFHNWTGNRITCRDWFQLCLKEGLTVYRDHEFAADQRSRPVRRIAEVRALKAHQFPEDQGPLAHPVRPRRYREINNFYTSTVYEKGSEVVRMLHTLLGAELFRKGMDLYFERHDGDAATVEDFLRVFEDVSGRNLSQFALWYHQAGTPNVHVATSYDARKRSFTIDLDQAVPPTRSEGRKRMMHIPLAFGIVGHNGADLDYQVVDRSVVADGVIHLRKRRQSVTLQNVASQPTLSLNRGFSAPVNIIAKPSTTEQVFLSRHDGDLFNRWQALNGILTVELVEAAREIRSNRPAQFGDSTLDLLGEIASDTQLEMAYRALALTLPGEADIAREIGDNIDPTSIHAAREALIAAVQNRNAKTFSRLYAELATSERFSPDAASAGRRALRNALLGYLEAGPRGVAIANAHFREATNMTDRLAGLTSLVHRFGGAPETVAALAAFEDRFGQDALVMDKWFAVQASAPGKGALDIVQKLTRHPGFSFANPNRVRALIGTFSSANQLGFNRQDGAGYIYLAQTLLEIDRSNPRLSARLATAMRAWRSLEANRKKKAREALSSLAAEQSLSVDLRDIVERTLG